MKVQAKYKAIVVNTSKLTKDMHLFRGLGVILQTMSGTVSMKVIGVHFFLLWQTAVMSLGPTRSVVWLSRKAVQEILN